MRASIIRTAALAVVSAVLPTVESAILPTVLADGPVILPTVLEAAPAILPTVLAAAPAILPTVLVTAPAVDGVQAIADALNSSALHLNLQANSIAAANAALSGNIYTNVAPTFDLARAISNATSTFWQTAFDVEKRVCVISSTINPQTVATAQANLIAGLQAQVAAVAKITAALQVTIISLKNLFYAFTYSEMAVVSDLVKALATAANASVEPVHTLAAAGTSLGLTELTQSAAELQGSIGVLVSTVASLNFFIT